jgi:PAT family beta-lactamase induction signal transducer AmpG
MKSFWRRNQRQGRTNSFYSIPSLFVAEEIPAALVCYVSPVLFLRFGADIGQAAFFSALNMLPWLLRFILRAPIHNIKDIRWPVLCCEGAMVLTIILLAVYLKHDAASLPIIFLLTFILGCLTAFHYAVSQHFYTVRLSSAQQNVYFKTKVTASQLATILTYGLTIILTGFLEIFLRNINRAWAISLYLLAGAMLIAWVYNLFLLPSASAIPHHGVRNVRTDSSLLPQVGQGWLIALYAITFLLLLSHALMICPRVFILLSPTRMGGFACSLQEVGFAQGTIGVTAYMLGTLAGRRQLTKKSISASTYLWLGLIMQLSPVGYFLLANSVFPAHLVTYSIIAAVAQFSFGMGLQLISCFLRILSKNTYQYSASLLFSPLGIATLFLPWALSGFMADAAGYQRFFLFDVACSLLACAMLLIFRRQIYRMIQTGTSFHSNP